MTNSFFRTLLFALSIAFFASCDYEYNDLGSDIIDDDIHHNMLRYEASVAAYDAATGAVQANNLPINSLGVYDNPVFGKTVASYVTQLQLASANPTLTNPVIDSVYLYVPYFSSYESTDEDGNNTYSLDSIYGNPEARIRLSIYENKYYLRTTDPGSGDASAQKYYSDEKSLVENNRGTLRLNDGTASQNDQFTFSKNEIKRFYVEDGESKVAETFQPGMFLYLNKEFFQQKILDAASGNLLNNSVFAEYFRGLYFKVEQIGDQQVMAMPRFDQGKITIKYTDNKLDTNGNPTNETEKKTITLNLTGNSINFFENTYTDAFTTAINQNDDASGDERLYIKGGAGAMAVIDVLSQEDIDLLRQERVLINEANLTFYVDKQAMANAKEPMRVYLYDLKNKRPLYDYSIDNTSNNAYPKYGKFVHGGLLAYDTDGRGLGYKVRITNHINNIINNDSTNVKLGLVVTENINVTSNASLKTPFTAGTTEVKTVPVSSVTHPFGTVLYGSNSSVPEEKRLKLEIFYTKPN
ncbi:DUF4270 domain-containing protein [Flavobacterium coralii]|uniref:DUF4270 domain-containing protein n=1 Tax=Flavobacterium coralii TaxID=2838017 RepID=UPI000C65EFCD|nr:hypothetical protein [Flavobacterium sp.]|tara:strand:+ start:15216 stop:16787 length:1572 start_codon:yes stop_codon:yes gene_type:complete